jgi:2-polyprenyl-3-methyl-5-hydroxy-6-metoxy-1,4-benzoquinol methylase
VAISAAQLARLATGLYRGIPPARRAQARLRPYICPFELLVPLVPAGSAVLDVGCGSGLFLGLLARLGRIRSGTGLDADAAAVAAAAAMARRLPAGGPRLAFRQLDARQPWPASDAEVVSLIDVLHHLPPARQLALVAQAAAAVPPHGLLLYKDMARRPRWSAAANQLHDLVLARDWIHHRALGEVEAAAVACGLELLARGRAQRAWYTHEWLLLTRRRGH